MLRAFSAFLSVFWLVGLSVHLDGVIHLFAMIAVLLFILDIVIKHPHPARVRGEPML
jgi:hypothetical protein